MTTLPQDNYSFANLPTTLDNIREEKALLVIKEQIALNKAFSSEDAGEVLKAQRFLKEWEVKNNSSSSQTKSILVDPYTLNSSAGYRQTPQKISYESLRNMSRIPIIRAIIETRKDQVSAFCNYTEDDYSTGFKIQKKTKKRVGEKDTLTDQERSNIEFLAEFILNCGNSEDVWYGDSFDSFLRKLTDDSLTLDQAVYEITSDRKGAPTQAIVTDAATYRLADTYNEKVTSDNKHLASRGYLPAYVQIINGQVENYFYPWELCFGVRNPQTNIHKAGYGRSELEDLTQTVIALVNADQYNGNFFKVGSNPRGIIKYSGNVNSTTLQDLKENWNAQVAGVNNMHKTPVINADKVDWINTHQSNRDMEYSSYQEFLIKITCAMYKIDPSEIGFNLSGNTESSPLFEGSNEARLKYSKDKGLKPLLKQIQFWINKYLITPKAPDYEFVFVGLDGGSEESELDTDIKQLNSFLTLNELREKRGLSALESGDVPLNPVYVNYIQALKSQQLQQEMQDMQMQSQESISNGIPEDEIYEDETIQDYPPESAEEENPINKAFSEYFTQLISKN